MDDDDDDERDEYRTNDDADSDDAPPSEQPSSAAPAADDDDHSPTSPSHSSAAPAPPPLPPTPTLPSSSSSYPRLVLQRHDSTTAPRFFAKTPIIDPILSIAHGTHVHALAVPPCGSHLLSGGADGFIRRISIYDSVTGSSAENLTMKQGGHVPVGDRGDEPKPFLEGYWENEDAPDAATTLPSDSSKMRFGPKSVGNATHVSPVYSLAIHDQELWALSGTESGRINLYSVRHDEGQIRHVFNSTSDRLDPPTAHRAGTAVSALELNDAQTRVLSGGWDGNVLDWDLNTGQMVNYYSAHNSQISTVSLRPRIKTSVYDEKEVVRNDDADMKDVEDDHHGVELTPAVKVEDVKVEEGDVMMKEEAVTDIVKQEPVASPIIVASIDEDEGEHSPSKTVVTDQDQVQDTSDGDLDALFDGDGDDEDATGSEILLPTLLDETPSLVVQSVTQTLEPTVLAPPAPKLSSKHVPPILDASSPPLGDHLLMTSGIDGQVYIWDRRISGRRSSSSSSSSSSGDSNDAGNFVRMLPMNRNTSRWTSSTSWSIDGHSVYVGRRNHCIDIYDLRFPNGVNNTIRLPISSGPVSSLLAWPDGKNLLCASFDNVRLWNLKADEDGIKIPFRIIPGNSSGVVSQMYVTPSQRYLITASGDRGWEAVSNEMVVIHEIRGLKTPLP